MTSSAIPDILDSYAELRRPIRVYGSQTLSQALILKSWLERFQQPLVVFCKNQDDSQVLYDDLTDLGVRTYILPTWDHSPYSSVFLGIKSRFSRLNCFFQTTLEKPGIWITTEPAALQRTLPPATFKSKLLNLSVGQRLDSREDLAQKLSELGYQRVDPVEDPGTFSIRGEIIDLFSPHSPHPVRIELFDTDIERIRYFDPETQKTLGTVPPSSIEVIPAREFIIDSSNRDRIRARVKERADQLGISRQVRDPFLDQIDAHYYPDHSELWSAYAYEQPSCFIDYLPGNTQWVWINAMECKQDLDQFIESLKTNESGLVGLGLVAPSPGELFQISGEVTAHDPIKSALLFEQLEFTEIDSSPENPDLAESQTLRPTHRLQVDHSINGLNEFYEKYPFWRDLKWKIQIACRTDSSLQRMKHILEDRQILSDAIQFSISMPSSSLRWPAQQIAILRDDDLLGIKKQKARSSGDPATPKNWVGLKSLSDLSIGDTIVHVNHGIGVYQGLVRMGTGDQESEFLVLEYSGKDKLYLPVYRLHLIQKYHAASESVGLDKLGGNQFEKTKQKIKDSIKKMAIDLVDLYAKRSLQEGVKLSAVDDQYELFQDAFPFQETFDQQKAIDDCIRDLTSGALMDRLVCGDVGFGKTEVAMRAAFLAVHSGKQVAVLVPTTVLCHQHELSFRNRMKKFAVRIESLSRFKTKIDQKKTLADMKEGKVDIVIGTHRLLSRDIAFKDLGLVIIDEEHRFGVEHKEKLKALKLNTHILTLTATPIPRTLQMTLSGLRDISAMTTPPIDRLPIRTFVSKYDEEIIKKAIEFELARGGQVFFVHNRVQTIFEISQRISELVPGIRIGVGHAQMPPDELEKVMLDFFEKRTQILICTTIIESGLDVSSANTIIINRAETFGLAQLYQLRGRVGRSPTRAYAYLLVRSSENLTGEAKQRLEVIQRFVELGSGFNIASYDLEIRGGGESTWCRTVRPYCCCWIRALYSALRRSRDRNPRKNIGLCYFF